MSPIPEAENETPRIQALRELLILDTPPERIFDDIVLLAAQACDTCFALITLVDSDREWFIAKKGIAASEQPRESGFGSQTIPHRDVVAASNLADDSRFSANALVASAPNIRFYAGAPIRTPTGEAIGALCVLDTIPRELSLSQIDMLRILARQVYTILASRLERLTLSDALANTKRAEQLSRSIVNALPIQYCILDENGRILASNQPRTGFNDHYHGDVRTLAAGENYPAVLEANPAACHGGKAFIEGVRSALNGAMPSFSLEYACRSGSGQQWFIGKVLPLPDREIGKLIVTHENISEHNRPDHRFRQAVESAPNAIVMVNASGTILLVNVQTEMSFGYSRTELVGQPVEMLMPERFRNAHTGYRQAYLADPVSRPMGAGRDLYGLRKDGTEFPVEIGLGLIENREETLVLSSIIDITERKRLEHRFRQAVESAPNAIVMVNESGIILMVNAQAELSFGYSRTEMTGQAVEMLVPERFRVAHIGFRQAYLAEPVSRPMGVGRELYGLRKDGSEFPVEIGLGLIDDADGTIILSSIIDITERKNANDNLKAALQEKEMLLKEVYHRVKNNLQVVSSLINLQAGNVKNEATVDLLKQSADRIKAMALLHEKLYHSKDLARIDFNEYIRSLVDHLLFGYGTRSGKIKIGMNIDNVFLDVDTAIPCGLIINELVSNALKHAFPDDRPGEIGITFTHAQDQFMLAIADNGIGLPADLDFKKSTSLGLQLVDSLTNQLMGQMSLDRENGSTFTLRFNKIT